MIDEGGLPISSALTFFTIRLVDLIETPQALPDSMASTSCEDLFQ